MKQNNDFEDSKEFEPETAKIKRNKFYERPPKKYKDIHFRRD
jgi:hypothetical protein